MHTYITYATHFVIVFFYQIKYQYILVISSCQCHFAYSTKNNMTGYAYVHLNLRFKAGPLRLKQPKNELKIRILPQTSILYLIRHATVILIVGLHL